jgi:hypothetical protein
MTTGHNVEISPSEWVAQNSKQFPLWASKTFLPLKKTDITVERLSLFPHQKFVRDYLQYKSPYRGLLLYHGLGAGKTCAAIAVAEIMKNEKDVIVMLLASLENNFRGEIMQCGHEKYIVRQHWRFVNVSDVKKKPAKVNVAISLIRKHGGYWETDPERPANFESLSAVSQHQINVQMNELINKKYKFISFNGITKKKFEAMSKDSNPFDNKLVIIDEAHMFISRVANKRALSVEIYRDLINAENAKIVLLTGTPIINHPNEIAYTLNLINGMNTVYRIRYNGNFANTSYLEAHKEVLSYEVAKSGNKRSVLITLTPRGFVKTPNGKLLFIGDKKCKTDTSSHAVSCNQGAQERIKGLIEELVDLGVNISKRSDHKQYTTEKMKLFPSDKDEFTEYFLDLPNRSIKNEELFLHRMIGLVSYYEHNDTNLYPTNLGTIDEEIYFSDYQFNKYAQKRQEEISKEKVSKYKKKQGGLFDDNMGVFSTFSRMLCNFSFPDEIERPFPKKSFFLKEELDLDDADMVAFGIDEQQQDDEKKKVIGDEVKKYNTAIKKALKALERNGSQYFNQNLQKYSPKFDRLLANLKLTKGTSMIYSQFRTVEGLGVLSLALKARGYAEMKLSLNKETNTYFIDVKKEDYMKPKYALFTTNKEESKILMQIFNSAVQDLDENIKNQLKEMDTEGSKNKNLRGSWIKILMITESGSTGISLKNVRQVHITEPYWNMSRIKQVIGRANRTNSHKDLPEDERNFQVFQYRMKITPKQLATSTYIKLNDGGLSTDQKIFNIAERKEEINSKILDVVKRGSVDCFIHNTNVRCHAFPLNVNVFEKAYIENLTDHMQSLRDDNLTTEIKMKPYKVVIENKAYIWLKDTNELFHYDIYAKARLLDAAGTLTDQKNKWYKLVLYN